MSDQQNAPASDDQEPSLFELPGDWLFRNLIETIVGSGAEVGVTVSVGGSVVSGIAISGEKYIDLFADSFIGDSTDEFRTIVGESLRTAKRVYEKPADADENWKRPHTGYFHLRNARYFSPGQSPLPNSGGMLWRGRLEAVDGFSLGNVDVD